MSIDTDSRNSSKCSYDDSFPPHFGKGYQLSSYIIEQQIGTGVFGRVYRARHSNLGRLVAIKVLRRSDIYVRQARVEVEMLQRCKQQDNLPVVNIIDSFFFIDYPIIVFELLDENLSQLKSRLIDERLSLCSVELIAAQVLKALQFLSQKNNRIIHGDIKPDNIMLELPKETNSNLTVKLIDFGSACYESKQIHSYVQSRRYRAPEVYTQQKDYTTSLDMWSIGCMLAELFTGSPLFLAHSSETLFEEWAALLGPLDLRVKSKVSKSRSSFSPNSKVRKASSSLAPMTSHDIHTINLLKKRIPMRMDSNASTNHYEDFIDLIRRCLIYDPDLRITPSEAMNHSFFNPRSNFVLEFKTGNRIEQTISQPSVACSTLFPYIGTPMIWSSTNSSRLTEGIVDEIITPIKLKRTRRSISNNIFQTPLKMLNFGNGSSSFSKKTYNNDQNNSVPKRLFFLGDINVL